MDNVKPDGKAGMGRVSSEKLQNLLLKSSIESVRPEPSLMVGLLQRVHSQSMKSPAHAIDVCEG